MNVLTTIRERVRAGLRAFVLGPGVVEHADAAWGHDPSTFSPEEYGEYIATSNGVYACATLRAELLSSLPLMLYRTKQVTRIYRSGRQKRAIEKTEATGGRLYELLQKVNPFWTFSKLVQFTELSRCLWGASPWFLERGESGRLPPREIWWGRPDRTWVVPHQTDYIAGWLYKPGNGMPDMPYSPGEVLWMAMPNPVDEYAGLSPLAAARLPADYASAAMKSNKNLFANGLQMGGYVAPKSGTQLTAAQAADIEMALDKRFKGVDKAHRWGVFRFEAELNEVGTTPKDAEFILGQKLALEDIARAYKVPLDLIGGQRTYDNVEAAMRAVWAHCIIPEARAIAADITEQLLPMFPGEADLAEFDTSDVDALKESEDAAWLREQGQIASGAMTINEWRQDKGLDPVPWGDAWWAPMGVSPVRDSEPEPLAETEVPPDTELVPPDDEEEPAGQEESAAEDEEQPIPGRSVRAMEFGGAEHVQVWTRLTERSDRFERQVSEVVQDLFRRQQASILARLRQRTVQDVEQEPFDRAEWVKRFRQQIRPQLKKVVKESGDSALQDLAIAIAFDVSEPAVVRFLERRAQRFAQQVNETTWEDLKRSLSKGLNEGEDIPQFEERVLAVMAERIRSTPETIARTEVIGALNGGTLEAWRQSRVVGGKVWIAAIDDRTRDSHRAAHGQEVALDGEFTVGNGRGPAPGQIGLPEEDIQCRCTMVAKVM